jgi:hypothetical protein
LVSGHEAKGKEHLSRLGKHGAGNACLYIKRLFDVQLPFLERLVGRPVAETKRR